MFHGGDTFTYKDEFQGKIIDYSSNINPMGPPKALKIELLKAYDELAYYPDIQYRELRKNISKYLKCDYEEVIIGSGAMEIISNMCLLFDRIAVFVPCFGEYIKRPKILGKEVVRFKFNEEFKVDCGELEKSLIKGDLLILGNPNNPTGLRIEREVLLEIYKLAYEKGAFLLLDEAFYEFCPEDYDSIELFRGKEKVCIVRAATKFFGLPGIRLGYAHVSESFRKKYKEIESPWSVNSYANAAGRIIFKDKAYIKETKEETERERNYMLHELSDINWLKPFKSHTNFILIKLLSGDEDEVFSKLISKGFMIRKASSFEGLDKTYIRLAVKDRKSNEGLIKALKEIKV
ncbi:pyridoxal phosphate-dependent aminotransferase [Clostridium guangxiense]|uniref:pyridoxal phosphate-dependent aminotransferase n=1 Tax=Clostridium guangxiense TaxID=1662055 RepID=UPI001E54EEDB|nr:histidinol-phosphate transaminase [Clostridium guangxiense]MCD2348510.1 aminotransferase class I/II-fold pyridoxal phosphate-dependent enzyme [Clostridium guangxiense]